MLRGEKRNVNGHFGTKTPLLPLENVFYSKIWLAIFSNVCVCLFVCLFVCLSVCLFVCLLVCLFGIASPEWACPGLPTLLFWTQSDELWPI